MRIGKVKFSWFSLILLLVGTLLLCLFASIPNSIVSAFSGSGSGTAGDPYVITNVSELQEMNQSLSSYYILGNDIDASATSGWNGGLGFLPIGNFTTDYGAIPLPFTGNFNGQYYNITSLYIRVYNGIDLFPNIGMFGYISGGTISNVSLINVSVYSTGDSIGGLVGNFITGTIVNCSTGGSVTSSAFSNIGGLVGGQSGGIINGSYSNCSVDGGSEVGGLVGLVEGGVITNSYSLGNVSSDGSDIGGLVGGRTGGAIIDSYSTGSVTGYSYLGGLVGKSTGGSVTNSFWNIDTSGQSTSVGGTGENTTQMKTRSTYTCAGWNFTICSNLGIWGLNSSMNLGYPFLMWQGYTSSGNPILTYSAGTRGYLTGSTSQTVSCGLNGTSVTAVPNTGCKFSNWSDSSTSNTRQDTNVTSDICVTANFVVVSPPSNFTSSTTSNSTIQLSWTPTTGANWTLIRKKTTGYPSNTTDGTLVYNGSGYSYLDSSLLSATHYYYSAWSYNSSSSFSLSSSNTNNYTMVDLKYSSSLGGTLKVYSPSGVSLGYFTSYNTSWYYNVSTGYQIQSISNDSCHYFLNWSDGNLNSIREDTGITSNLSVTANIPLYYSSINFSLGSSGGNLSGTVNQSVVCGNYSSYVTAVPDPLHNFSYWSYITGGTGTLLSTSISIQALPYGYPISLSAYFISNGNVSLHYGNLSGGYLTGSTLQYVAIGGNGTAVTAVPYSGYQFSSWSDGSVVNPRTDTNVSSNIYVTANFATMTYTLTTGAVYGSILTPGQPGSFTYNASQNVSLVAQPANSYCTFINWTGSTGTIGNISSASTYIIMKGNYIIQANFNYTGPVPSITPTPNQNFITTNLSSFGITDVKVFRNYLVTGDELFLIYYRVIQYPTPSFSTTNYLNLDIYGSGILKARSKVLFWGYAPSSIYLKPSSALPWGSIYTVELQGISGMWSTLPNPGTYNLSTVDWVGTDMKQLDTWILSTAQSIDAQNGVSQYLTNYVAGYNNVLSNTGCSIFNTAIPSLSQQRPDLCSISASSINPNSTASENLSRKGQTALTNNFGTTVMTSFNNLGADMGVKGSVLAGLFWFVLMLLVAGIGTAASRNSVVGVIISLPILFIGNYLGVVSLSLMGVIGTLCILYLLRQLWLVGQ